MGESGNEQLPDEVTDGPAVVGGSPLELVDQPGRQADRDESTALIGWAGRDADGTIGIKRVDVDEPGLVNRARGAGKRLARRTKPPRVSVSVAVAARRH